MSKVNEFDKKHLSNLAKASKSIDTLYAAAAKELSRIAESTGHTGDEPFSFDKYPAAKRRAEKVYKELDANLLDLITTGEEEAWELSYDKNCALVDRITKGSGLTGEQIDRFKPRNMEALSAFQERKVNGMQLSENVWTIVDNGKTEFELALDVALGDGRSAAMLSRDVRKYLKDPAMLFRRVRGKDGVLRLSERARNYHPGQGVYRSSYKNAMRLARTEVNMAYHTADYEAWKDNDLVLGYEIILSNNHIPDICDELAGKYPKDFKFVGWHPQCRCVAVPITPSQEEFLKYAKAELNGEDVSDYQFEEVDFDGPAKLEGWAEENRERAKGWANMPYFVSDNPKYVSFTEKKTALEIAEERHEVLTKVENKSIAGNGGVKSAEAKVKYYTKEECNYALPNGGSVSTPDGRVEKSHRSKNEAIKFQKELKMVARFANSGHKIEFVADDTGSYDVLIDGIKADLKSTSSPGNIVKYAKHATREQGADIVLFEFNSWGTKYIEAIGKLKRIGIHGKYLLPDDVHIYVF